MISHIRGLLWLYSRLGSMHSIFRFFDDIGLRFYHLGSKLVSMFFEIVSTSVAEDFARCRANMREFRRARIFWCTKSFGTNIGTIPKNMPIIYQFWRLNPKLDIFEKPENRVHRPYSRISLRKSTNVGNHSHSCKFAGTFFVNTSITVKMPGHGTGG